MLKMILKYAYSGNLVLHHYDHSLCCFSCKPLCIPLLSTFHKISDHIHLLFFKMNDCSYQLLSKKSTNIRIGKMWYNLFALFLTQPLHSSTYNELAHLSVNPLQPCTCWLSSLTIVFQNWCWSFLVSVCKAKQPHWKLSAHENEGQRRTKMLCINLYLLTGWIFTCMFFSKCSTSLLLGLMKDNL